MPSLFRGDRLQSSMACRSTDVRVLCYFRLLSSILVGLLRGIIGNRSEICEVPRHCIIFLLGSQHCVLRPVRFRDHDAKEAASLKAARCSRYCVHFWHVPVGNINYSSLGDFRRVCTMALKEH